MPGVRCQEAVEVSSIGIRNRSRHQVIGFRRYLELRTGFSWALGFLLAPDTWHQFSNLALDTREDTT